MEFEIINKNGKQFRKEKPVLGGLVPAIIAVGVGMMVLSMMSQSLSN